jgi:hypothetical protein
MNVAQFQKCYNINLTISNDVERMGYICCELYGLTYNQANNLSQANFTKYAKRIEKDFSKVYKPKYFKRFKLEPDATKLRLGQFIELQHYLKSDLKSVISKVAATISQQKKPNKEIEQAVLKANIRYVLPYVLEAVNSLEMLVSKYPYLFEQPPANMDEPISKEALKVHPFVASYGWIDQAKVLADYFNIKFNEAMELGVIESLNILSLIKAKNAYTNEVNK